ncbi:MAG: VWA domain-containing protein [Chloroflexi bacterium]|nr:VWA domain-containing protein [Chloroflexota bacterium]
MSYFVANLVRFGRLLRAAGVPVTPAQIGDLAQALTHIDLSRRDDVKSAARAVLVSRREQLPLFEHAFELFWRSLGRDASDVLERMHLEQEIRSKHSLTAIASRGARQAKEPPEETILATYSAVEILRYKPFAQLTPEEMEAVKRLLCEMPWSLGERRTRRMKRARRGERLDWRAILRQSWRYGGEPLQLSRRMRKIKPRPLVVLCDVSGSMSRYTRLLLQFIYALERGLEHVEAFLFSTKLHRITPYLRQRSVDAALAEISFRVQEMGGGTQIGRALKTFNVVWARRVLGRGAIVILVSDGWDRGEPEEIRRQMERLQLSASRLIWLNPWLGIPGYKPLTRGMQAALPYIDDFLPIHNLYSLEQLAALLASTPSNKSCPPLSNLSPTFPKVAVKT